MPSSVINGINLDDLPSQVEEFTPPPLVTGRTVHIDADFLAYQVSADEDKALSEMQQNCDVRIEKIRLLSGATSAVLHLTPKGSDKGQRYEIAKLKEYQANRKDKPKPRYLNYMREWMHKERGATLHVTCEADDGMSMAQYAMIKAGTPELSVIATKDKDLAMVPGLQINWDTFEITNTTTNFGHITLDTSGSSKKIKGRGQKLFWAQLLTGDTADNISGLPKLCTGRFLKGKPKLCGSVTAFEILQDVASNKEAFELVKELYKDCGSSMGYKHWRTGESISWQSAFVSEAQLLWMRREHDPYDVVHWMQEINNESIQ